MKMRTILLFSCALFIGVCVSLVLCTRPLVLERMITKQVLETVVSELAEDLKDVPHERSYTRSYGLMWATGYYARTGVYQSERDKRNLQEPSEFTRLYEDIMRVARDRLRTPGGLRVLYFVYKRDVLALVQEYGIAAEVKQELLEILPYFDGSLDPEIARHCEARRDAWQAMEEDVENYGPYSTLVNWLLKHHGLTKRNFNYYEWPLRRKAEGGQALVDTWAWIISDFAAAL